MKKYIYTIAIILCIATIASATTGITFSFNITTSQQDTYIQGTLIPVANKNLCAQYGLSSNCTASNLTTAGCVAVAASSITKRALTYQNCTPFTLDVAGENAMAADIFAKAMVALVESDKANSIVSACTNFKALSASNQNSICSTLGSPVPATVCDICQ